MTGRVLTPPVVAEGHVLGDEPSVKQGLHARWDCRTCGCYVWVRAQQEPYGTAISAACSTVVGRGRLFCGVCNGLWEWPGTFADESAARAYMTEHRCGPGYLDLRVIAPARPLSPSGDTGATT